MENTIKNTFPSQHVRNWIHANPQLAHFANLTRYLQHYNKLIVQKYGYFPKDVIQSYARELREVPITHGASIDDMSKVLRGKSLLSHEDRTKQGIKSSVSGILGPDYSAGLTSYVFASFGSNPTYGESDTCVTLLLSDALSAKPSSFFTFYEKATFRDKFSDPRDQIGLGLRNKNDDGRLEYSKKNQYNHGRLPLAFLHEMLARILYLKGTKPKEIYAPEKMNGKRLPKVFLPDFQLKDWADPEIKLASPVATEHILGYAVIDPSVISIVGLPYYNDLPPATIEMLFEKVGQHGVMFKANAKEAIEQHIKESYIRDRYNCFFKFYSSRQRPGERLLRLGIPANKIHTFVPGINHNSQLCEFKRALLSR